jgi:hypothetical protein
MAGLMGSSALVLAVLCVEAGLAGRQDLVQGEGISEVKVCDMQARGTKVRRVRPANELKWQLLLLPTSRYLQQPDAHMTTIPMHCLTKTADDQLDSVCTAPCTPGRVPQHVCRALR